MKFFYALLIISIIVFTSCDGKERAKFTPEEKLKHSDLPDSFFLQEKYFPEHYSEVVTDTILSNNITISIKTYTDMNNNVLNDFKRDTIHYKYFFREIVSDLKITIGGKSIFNKTIDKSYFQNKKDSFFWDKALMLGLYINETKTTNEQFYFNVSYCMIESENCIDYYLIIDQNGKLEMKELPTQEIH